MPDGRLSTATEGDMQWPQQNGKRTSPRAMRRNASSERALSMAVNSCIRQGVFSVSSATAIPSP
jgi:hypothetical protein